MANHEEHKDLHTQHVHHHDQHHHENSGHHHDHHEHSEHNHGHSEHHRMMIRDFRKRFFVTIVLTIPVLALTPFIQNILGFTLGFNGAPFVVFILATAIYFYEDGLYYPV